MARNTPESMMALVLRVQSGTLTATAAANLLGLSRKTYYQWESRALAGMLAALRPGRPGRPRTRPAGEELRLRAELESLKRDHELLRQRLAVREALAEADGRSKKKRGDPDRGPNRPGAA